MIRLIPAVKAPSAWRRDNASTALADLEFSQRRGAALRRANRRCQGCKAQCQRLEVHHRNNDHADNSLANLIGLCRYCHAVFHAGFHQAGLGGSINSRWYLAARPLPEGLQAKISHWALGQADPPELPRGEWMSAEEVGDFIGHLEALAEGRHPEVAVVQDLCLRALWIPVYPEKNYRHTA